MRVSMLGADSLTTGLFLPTHPKLPLHTRQPIVVKFSNLNTIQLVPARIARRSKPFLADRLSSKYVASVGRDNPHYGLNNDDESREPFLLSLIKESIWGLRSLFTFLVEQPSQLRFIEWPSFQSTVKTATLTLMLVGLLVVVLSSVDSALCYLLALLLRRTS